jgi:hypothetical protein
MDFPRMKGFMKKIVQKVVIISDFPDVLGSMKSGDKKLKDNIE